MKPLFLLLPALLLSACSSEDIVTSPEDIPISIRSLEPYYIVYQVPAGDIDVVSATDPNDDPWTPEPIASTTPSLYGTSTTLYNYSIPDDERRIITIFQDSSEDLYWTEYEDGSAGWTTPDDLASAS